MRQRASTDHTWDGGELPGYFGVWARAGETTPLNLGVTRSTTMLEAPDCTFVPRKLGAIRSSKVLYTSLDRYETWTLDDQP